MSRLFSRRGSSPAAIVLLLITAMMGGGLELRPAAAGGCSIATDDHLPDPPQPRDESPDESTEDEEGESAKHAALGCSLAVDPPAARGGTLSDCHGRLTAGARLAAAPIRGPPSQG